MYKLIPRSLIQSNSDLFRSIFLLQKLVKLPWLIKLIENYLKYFIFEGLIKEPLGEVSEDLAIEFNGHSSRVSVLSYPASSA